MNDNKVPIHMEFTDNSSLLKFDKKSRYIAV